MIWLCGGQIEMYIYTGITLQYVKPWQCPLWTLHLNFILDTFNTQSATISALNSLLHMQCKLQAAPITYNLPHIRLKYEVSEMYCVCVYKCVVTFVRISVSLSSIARSSRTKFWLLPSNYYQIYSFTMCKQFVFFVPDVFRHILFFLHTKWVTLIKYSVIRFFYLCIGAYATIYAVLFSPFDQCWLVLQTIFFLFRVA